MLRLNIRFYVVLLSRGFIAVTINTIVSFSYVIITFAYQQLRELTAFQWDETSSRLVFLPF